MKCDELKRIESDSADIVLSCFQDVYEADSVDAAIAELKKELEHSNVELESYFIFEEEIKAELRATRRALWLARANSAEGQFSFWCARFATESGFTKTDIRGYTVNTKRKLRTIGEWIETWKNVKHKCLKKAEEYK